MWIVGRVRQELIELTKQIIVVLRERKVLLEDLTDDRQKKEKMLLEDLTDDNKNRRCVGFFCRGDLLHGYVFTLKRTEILSCTSVIENCWSS